jgi:hypothetical protein
MELVSDFIDKEVGVFTGSDDDALDGSNTVQVGHL